jgi:hypothetical protein
MKITEKLLILQQTYVLKIVYPFGVNFSTPGISGYFEVGPGVNFKKLLR